MRTCWCRFRHPVPSLHQHLLFNDSDCSVPYASLPRLWHSMLSLLQPVDRFAFSTCFNAEAWPSGHDLKPFTIFSVRLVPSSCCSVHVLQPSVQWLPCLAQSCACLPLAGPSHPLPIHTPGQPCAVHLCPSVPVPRPALPCIPISGTWPSKPSCNKIKAAISLVVDSARLQSCACSSGLGWLPVDGRASTGLAAPSFCGSCALVPTHLC